MGVGHMHGSSKLNEEDDGYGDEDEIDDDEELASDDDPSQKEESSAMRSELENYTNQNLPVQSLPG